MGLKINKGNSPSYTTDDQKSVDCQYPGKGSVWVCKTPLCWQAAAQHNSQQWKQGTGTFGDIWHQVTAQLKSQRSSLPATVAQMPNRQTTKQMTSVGPQVKIGSHILVKALGKLPREHKSLTQCSCCCDSLYKSATMFTLLYYIYNTTNMYIVTIIYSCLFVTDRQ